VNTSKEEYVRIPWVRSVEDLDRLKHWRASEQAKDVTPKNALDGLLTESKS